jgi:hypothetical protein
MIRRATYLPLIALLLASCSHEVKHPAAMEAVELLDLLEERQKRHDPQAYIEVDLGRFAVTHPLAEGEGAVMVSFHLYGVLPEERQAALEQALPGVTYRLRDAAISLVQRIETDHLTDPSLSFFKAELVAAINRVLGERLLRDVAFSDFAVSPEMEVPWPQGSEKPEKPKGGHGGGHGGH